MKTALILGHKGQDGTYLSKLLVEKGYFIFGVDKDNPFFDLADLNKTIELIKMANPDECYHLAANSVVDAFNFEDHESFQFNVDSILNVLTAIKKTSPKTKLFFAGSSEQFGNAVESPQCETTPFNPRSLYGISKVVGYNMVKYFRETHGLFSCTGIMYNHESPLRPDHFVTQKIVKTALKIKSTKTASLPLGNTRSIRDWGFAGDYVEAMWMMLQAAWPNDYVIGTGTPHSVHDFAQEVFNQLELELKNHLNTGIKRLERPSEVVPLVADPRKIYKDLGWKAKTTLPELIKIMLSGVF